MVVGVIHQLTQLTDNQRKFKCQSTHSRTSLYLRFSILERQWQVNKTIFLTLFCGNDILPFIILGFDPLKCFQKAKAPSREKHDIHDLFLCSFVSSFWSQNHYIRKIPSSKQKSILPAHFKNSKVHAHIQPCPLLFCFCFLGFCVCSKIFYPL